MAFRGCTLIQPAKWTAVSHREGGGDTPEQFGSRTRHVHIDAEMAGTRPSGRRASRRAKPGLLSSIKTGFNLGFLRRIQTIQTYNQIKSICPKSSRFFWMDFDCHPFAMWQSWSFFETIFLKVKNLLFWSCFWTLGRGGHSSTHPLTGRGAREGPGH